MAAVLIGGCQSLGPLEPLRELFQSETPVEPPAPLPEFTPEIEAVVLWHHDFGGEGERLLGLVPVFDAQGRLYVATLRGELFSLDLAGGALEKREELKLSLTAGPALDGENLYLGAENLLVAADREDLKMAWRKETSGLILAAPTGSDEAITTLCSDGTIEVFDHQGKRLWRYRQTPPPLSLRGDPSPVILSDGTLLVAFADGTLARFELLSGKLLWKRKVALASGESEVERVVDINETPVVEDDVAYLSAYYGGVMAVSLFEGEPLWVRRDIVAAHAPALDVPFLFVSDMRGDLWALDPETGQSYWKQEALHRRNLTAPAVLGNLVAVGDFEGYVHFLTQTEGRIVGRVRVGNAPIKKLLPTGSVGVLVWSRAGDLALIGIKR